MLLHTSYLIYIHMNHNLVDSFLFVYSKLNLPHKLLIVVLLLLLTTFVHTLHRLMDIPFGNNKRRHLRHHRPKFQMLHMLPLLVLSTNNIFHH